MLNIRRLFSRTDRLTDAEMAYIEGRATEDEAGEVREKFAPSPELEADLESLRATVNLLRSVQPEVAPRSFALVEAPAFARATSRRMAFAPAMAAIVAAVGVGLLAAGDLTGYVSQSGTDGGSRESSSSTFETSMIGPDGPAGPPLSSDSNGDAPVSSITAAATPSAPSDPLLYSDSGYGISPEEYDRLQATIASAEVDEQAGETGMLDLARSSESKISGDASSGIELPLWQLQISLAILAAVMIAAWAFIRRRATA